MYNFFFNEFIHVYAKLINCDAEKYGTTKFKQMKKNT